LPVSKFYISANESWHHDRVPTLRRAKVDKKLQSKEIKAPAPSFVVHKDARRSLFHCHPQFINASSNGWIKTEIQSRRECQILRLSSKIVRAFDAMESKMKFLRPGTQKADVGDAFKSKKFLRRYLCAAE